MKNAHSVEFKLDKYVIKKSQTNHKMKFYISLPIGGYENTVRERYEDAKKRILNEYPGAIVSGPVNIDKFDNTGLTMKRDHDWNWYIGEDVKELLTCTHIYLCRGYLYSKGCRTELAVADANYILPKYHPFAFMKL